MSLTDYVIIHIDGASRGNPGPAACGVIVRNGKGEVLAKVGRFLGHTTNNLAEYQALLVALNHSLKEGYYRIEVFSDSELLTRQINGQYKVKNSNLLPLYMRAQELISQFDKFSITHVKRENNRDADQLANSTLDSA